MKKILISFFVLALSVDDFSQNEQLARDIEKYVHEVDSLIKHCYKILSMHGHHDDGSTTYWFELCNDSVHKAKTWEECDLLKESLYAHPSDFANRTEQSWEFGYKQTIIDKYYQNEKLTAIIKKVNLNNAITRNLVDRTTTREEKKELAKTILYIYDGRIIFYEGEIDDEDIKSIIQKYSLQFYVRDN